MVPMVVRIICQKKKIWKLHVQLLLYFPVVFILNCHGEFFINENPYQRTFRFTKILITDTFWNLKMLIPDILRLYFDPEWVMCFLGMWCTSFAIDLMWAKRLSISEN